MISFVVPGIPKPKGSMKRFPNGGVTHDNPGTRPWADTIGWHARQVMRSEPPIDGPVTVNLHFMLPKPKSVKRKDPTVKPDLDKLTRNALDALTSICWIDDAQVTQINASKSYAGDEGPRLFVGVYRADEEF